MKRTLEMTNKDLECVMDYIRTIPLEDYGKVNFNFNDYDETWLMRRKQNRLSIKSVMVGERRKYKVGGYEICSCGILKRCGKDLYHIHNKYHKLWLKQNLV